MFIESKYPKHWIVCVVVIFIVLTVPNSWLPELSRQEAVYTIVAEEIVKNGDYFFARPFGKPADVSPLTPWFLSLIFRVFPINEFTIRLVGLLPMGGLVALCAYISYRSAGARAAAATAVAVISNPMVLSHGVAGDETMMFCLLVNASWFSWYILGRVQRNWLYAWFFAHLFVFFAVLAGGFEAVFFFYFPLLFLRRPLKIWLRLRQADHILSAVILGIFLMFWIFMSPHQAEKVVNFFQKFEHYEPSSNYFLHLVFFPLISILKYAPWLFLVWPAYCVAFHPLEKDPILGQFLRTISSSLFFFFWVFPEISSAILAPLVGTLSVSLGLNYEILVRRYGKQLSSLPRAIVVLTLAAVGGCGMMMLIRGSGVLPSPELMLLSITFLLLSAVLAVILFITRVNLQIWFAVALSVVVSRLAYTSTYHGLWAYGRISEKRRLAERLSENLPNEAMVYEMIADNQTFPSECYYLHRPVTKIGDVTELPYYEDTVFVLSHDEVPISQNRNWFPVSEVVHYKDYSLQMWKGEKRIIRINPDSLEFRFNVTNQTFEQDNLKVLISHRFSKSIPVRLLDSEEGYVEILGEREIILPPEKVFEFEVQPASRISPVRELRDFILIEFVDHNKTVSRSVSISIKPYSDVSQ